MAILLLYNIAEREMFQIINHDYSSGVWNSLGTGMIIALNTSTNLYVQKVSIVIIAASSSGLQVA